MNNGINGLFWSCGPQWKASGFEFGNASWEKMTLSTTGPLEPDPPPLSPDGQQVKRPPPSLQITSNFLVFYGLSHDITLEKKCVVQTLIYSKI